MCTLSYDWVIEDQLCKILCKEPGTKISFYFNELKKRDCCINKC